MAFKYQERTREQLQKRASQSGGAREGYIMDKYRVWTPREGEHRVRILPPTWEGAQHFGIDVFAHYNIGMENSVFLCVQNSPDVCDKEDCALCTARAKAGENRDEVLADALKPRKRVLVWIIDRNNQSDGPQIWPMPYTIDRDLAGLVVDDEGKGVLTIDHPDDGIDVLFKREGKDTRTRYVAVKLARKSTSLSDEDDDYDDWLDYISDNPLPDCVVIPDAKHVADVWEAGGIFARGERDDDRKPRGGRDRNEDNEERGSSRNRRARSNGHDEEEEGRRRRSDDDDDRRVSSRQSRRSPKLPEDYEALEAMSEDELIELAEAHDIKLNSRKDVLPQVADALGYEPPKKASRRAADDDDDKPSRRRARAVEDEEPEEKPRERPRMRSRAAEDEPEEKPSRRRSRVEDEEPEEKPARRARNGEDEDEKPSRRRARADEDEDDKPARPRMNVDKEGSRVNRLRRGVSSSRD